MRRGQGSLEYLLILAAILAIAVVVVIVATSLLSAPTEATAVQEDKYAFAVSGFELMGYDSALDPSDLQTAPASITKAGVAWSNPSVVSEQPIGADYLGSLTGADGTVYSMYGYENGGDYYILTGSGVSSLVAHWEFEETGDTAFDSTGNGHNGGIEGGPIQVPGPTGHGSALEFDGIDDTIQITNHASLTPASITVSFWAKLEDMGDRHVLVTKWYGFTTEVNADGTFKWGLHNTAGSQFGQYFGTQSISYGEWHHLVGTFDDTTKVQATYIDGLPSESRTVDTNPSINYGTTNLQISYVGFEVKGVIDDVRIYNKALTANDIQVIYNS